jgi:hypothetical protein
LTALDGSPWATGRAFVSYLTFHAAKAAQTVDQLPQQTQ